MAKDAKGHGSEARGGGSYMNIDRSGFRKGQHVGYGDGTFRIQKNGSGYVGTEQRTGERLTGNSLGHMSSQLSDRAAAATLRQSAGPKSSTPPVHPAMGSPFNHTSMNLRSGVVSARKQPVKSFGR